MSAAGNLIAVLVSPEWMILSGIVTSPENVTAAPVILLTVMSGVPVNPPAVPEVLPVTLPVRAPTKPPLAVTIPAAAMLPLIHLVWLQLVL